MDWFDTPDARLALTAVLNVAVLWTSVRLARLLDARADTVQRAVDIILLFSAISGGSVCLLGWVGLLRLVPLIVLVGVVTAATAALTRPKQTDRPISRQPDERQPKTSGFDSAHVVVACLTLGLLTVMLWVATVRPPLVTDALAYHLLLPARWLQVGGIELHPVWFHNPANTYSPLWASCLFAWCMLPMGNDLLARFAQVPFLVLCGLCLYRLLRQAGVDAVVAAGVGAIACLSRPFMGEGFCAKDDVILTAYFLCLVLALTGDRMRSGGGGIRAGLALGMLMATKYIAVLSLPVIAVLAAPSLRDRQSRKHYAWVVVLALAVAGPWYLRNLILTGNPLFPIEVRLGAMTVLPGLFSTQVAQEYQGFDGLLKVFLNTGRFALRPWMLVMLASGWVAGLALTARQWRQVPVLAGLLGPLLVLAIFYVVSPDREIRYVFPALALLFLATGLGLGRLPGPVWLRRVLTLALLACAILIDVRAAIMLDLIAVGLALGVVFFFVWYAWQRGYLERLGEGRLAIAALVGLLVIGYAYVYWGAYVERCRGNYPLAWSIAYRQDGLGQAWAWIAANAGPTDVVASTGTPMTYPLMGFDLQRRVVYVPIQPNASTYTELPRIDSPLTSREIVPATAALYRSAPDQNHWLDGIERRRVRYLLTTPFLGDEPIEAQWARSSDRFRVAFQAEQTTVFEVVP